MRPWQADRGALWINRRMTEVSRRREVAAVARPERAALSVQPLSMAHELPERRPGSSSEVASAQMDKLALDSTPCLLETGCEAGVVDLLRLRLTQ